MKNTRPTRLTVLSLLLGLLLILPGAARADNDDMFPPAPAAASSINFDGRGFLIHGKRTFVASGGMEYTRIPRALWRDRLLRLKRAGFNCVEIYTFWDVHEPRPSEFDFSGNADLDAFLKTVQSLGLYAIVRVGPYVCAEWDSGGYPVWLRFVPGLRVRENNAPFLAAVDRYWDKLMPIVAANQINRGGPVILVQLENEHPQGWGKVLPNAYFVHLRDKAVALGLQVPYFFSGLHHSSDPAGDKPWSSRGRTSPWFSTEFWSIWYDQYGAKDGDADTYERRFWKVLAYGGNGLNFYMFHGGSNFGFTNDNEDTASYDYGAAIGQMGDLRPTYYRFKQAALFARSFQDILENSDNATETYQAAATDPAIRVTARKSPSGTILFLDNPGKKDVKTRIKEADGSLFPTLQPITIRPGKIVPMVRDFPLLPGVVLERATPLLGIVKGGSITTVVTAGTFKDLAELRFRLAKPATNVHASANVFTRTKGGVTVRCALGGAIENCTFRVGSQTIRVLGTSTASTDSTWFLDRNIVINAAYVSDTSVVKGKLHITEETLSKPPNPPLLLFKSESAAATTMDTEERSTDLGPLERPLTGWETRSGSLEAGVSYGDTAWKTSADPLAMGADGDASAYAWYRSTLSIPKGGAYTLHFADGGDRASVFIDGKHSASGTVKVGVPLTLPAGTYTLAVLTAHYGRPKLFGYLGPIDSVDAKGLRGQVTLNAGTGQETEIKSWRVQADADADRALPPTDTTGAGWADGTTGPDVFHDRHGFAWYVAPLPASSIPAAGGLRRLRFENVDDNATIFLNAKRLAAHQGWGSAFDVPLDAAWNETGLNTLAVLVENTDQGGGIQGKVTLQTVSRENEIAVTGWKMHGGIGEPDALTGWTSGSDATADGAPAFYRARFQKLPSLDEEGWPIHGFRVVLRVETEGLSHGFMWLNGHNLGRYPEKIPVKGLYLPECWLRPSGNELVIYDEEGRSPTGVILKTEPVGNWYMNVQSYYVVHPTEQ